MSREDDTCLKRGEQRDFIGVAADGLVSEIRTKVGRSMISARKIQQAIFQQFVSSSSLLMPCYTPRAWYECDVWRVTKAGLAVEYEIKLTRADFLADRRKRSRTRHRYVDGQWQRTVPRTKHERLAESDPAGPSRFFFVLPVGVVPVEAIPEWAGLIECQEIGQQVIIHQVRAARKLHAVPADERSIKAAFRNSYYRMWSYMGCDLAAGKESSEVA